MQQPVGGLATLSASPRRTMKPFRMVDLTALAARQILRGRCVLARAVSAILRTAGIDIARKRHAIGFRTATHSATRSRRTTVTALTLTTAVMAIG